VHDGSIPTSWLWHTATPDQIRDFSRILPPAWPGPAGRLWNGSPTTIPTIWSGCCASTLAAPADLDRRHQQHDLDRVGALLFDRGICATLAFYPGVPKHQVGYRLQLTAANTNDQVDQLLVMLDELADHNVLRPQFP
jgi:hypothetical protein